MNTVLTWDHMVARLREQAPRRGYAIQKHRIEHPHDGGLTFSVGMPIGQRASYMRRLEGGEVLAVEELRDRYLARLRRPVMRGVEGALEETPGASVLTLLALGGVIGLALGRSGEAALVGAVVGGVAGLAAVAVANAEAQPDTSYAARETLRLATAALGARGLNPALDGGGGLTASPMHGRDRERGSTT